MQLAELATFQLPQGLYQWLKHVLDTPNLWEGQSIISI